MIKVPLGLRDHPVLQALPVLRVLQDRVRLVWLVPKDQLARPGLLVPPVPPDRKVLLVPLETLVFKVLPVFRVLQDRVRLV